MSASSHEISISSYKLPVRSELWTEGLTSVSTPLSLESVAPRTPLPTLKEAVRVKMPMNYSNNPSPTITPKNRKEWTAREREIAEKAPEVTTTRGLAAKVCSTKSFLIQN